MRKGIVGLTGQFCTGKGTVATAIIKESGNRGLDCKRVGFSDVIRETLNLWGIETTRENMQLLPCLMNDFGTGALARAIKLNLDRTEADLVVLESLKWPADLELLRSYPESILIAVVARDEIAYQRMLSRPEGYVGEDQASFGKFLELRQAPTEVHIQELVANADYVIDNNHEDDHWIKLHLEEQVGIFFETLLMPVLTQ